MFCEHIFSGEKNCENEPTVKELKERRLGAGSAFNAAEFQIVPGATDSSLVHQQVLQPQRRSFANRRQLSGLKMSEAQSGQIAVLVSELREALDYTG